EACDTSGGDPVTVDDRCAVEELAQVIPVEVPAVPEFLDQACRIKNNPRLPELQHHQAADLRLVERPRGEYAEVVDVARLVALIAGADFFGEDFGQRKAGDFRGRERQQLEITLLDLRPRLCRQRWCLAPADLKLH